MKNEWSTKLNDGQQIFGHDDWCCLQDFAAEGLLSTDTVVPGKIIQLSSKGHDLVSRLRRHKQDGKMYESYRAE